MDNNYYSEEQQNNMQKVFYEEPVSVKEWVITLLIMVIPIVNLVMIFVWAFGSKQKVWQQFFQKKSFVWQSMKFMHDMEESLMIRTYKNILMKKIGILELLTQKILMKVFLIKQKSIIYDF